MPIRVTCSCGKKLTAKDELAGKRAKCPACGAAIPIPQATTAARSVFISHAHADKATADAMCAKLESSGVRCWIAPRDILPGKDWGEAILDAINECAIMVLVFSEDSNQSKQVRREIERAVNRGIVIIPFRLNDVPMSKSLEYFLSSHHWLDAMTPPLEEHLQSLAKSVHTLLGNREPRSRAHEQPTPQTLSTECVDEPPPASTIAPANAALVRASERGMVNDYAGAISELCVALRADPLFAKAYDARAFYQYIQNNHRLALADSDEAIRLWPRSSGFYLNRAAAKMGLGDNVGACADYDEAINRGVTSAVVFSNRAICKCGRDNEGAELDFNRAIELDPSCASTYQVRGGVRAARGEWHGAIADLNKALSLDPNLQNSYQNRALARLNVQDFDGALGDSNLAIQLLSPGATDLVAYFYRGECKRNKNEFESAILDYDACIAANANADYAYVKRGLARLCINQFDGAMADYNHALELNPNNVEAYAQRAILWWYHHHDEVNARADARRVLALNPQFVLPQGLPR